MSRTPCRTAESDAGSGVFDAYFGRPQGAHRSLKTLAGITLGMALGVVTFIALGNAFGMLISLTDSAAPAGVYRIVSGGFRRGDLVAVCLPIAIAQTGLARGYLRGGFCPGQTEPVGKIIGAMPGDRVEIEPGYVSVNGAPFERSAVASKDTAGRPLSHVTWGSHRVGTSEIWLFGFNDRRSWDSRYFGPVPLADVRGRIMPIVTW
jgi:conjugative transfer signal peptidase TraF